MAADPSAESIQSALREVLAQPHYDLERRTQLAFDLSAYLEPLAKFIESVWDYLTGLLDSVLGVGEVGANLIFWALIAILVALLAKMVYTLVHATGRQQGRTVTLDDAPPATADELQAQASVLARQGNFVDASRTLFRAALVLLEERRGGRLRKGLTNREYIRTFSKPWVIEHLNTFVWLIDNKWYRDNAFDAGDYEKCGQALQSLRDRLEESA